MTILSPNSNIPGLGPGLVTRFAPSPTGLLHLGHAASALAGWHAARTAGGRFLLRLEDIDPQRCRPGYAQAILEDLGWLGLDWDGEVRVQSGHLDDYRCVLGNLHRRGLLYECFCSRAAIARETALSVAAPHVSPDHVPLYPGTCRRLDPELRRRRSAAGEPFVLRLDMRSALAGLACTERALLARDADTGRDRQCHPERFGDVVLARRDVPASYHLCVTHDDWLQGVTLVVRGEDLLPATDVHRLLQALMGWTPPAWSHHHLLLDRDGRRLAKRDGAPTLRAMRADGMTAAHVRALAGFP
ncbi:tRNA glutamyl-Q(34) synthetase GluQRS [Lichenicoccus roseus]|uniref:tRNA glutamyl-Q(34) synthetase GluQRS n=1 Tax=Lichenicoccus roseus TaxID=2683649 RepID=UPI001F0DD147|nr:tRNA glutamyl-Q(34) synthetase GluQRS [Lichenicoccus roseus]